MRDTGACDTNTMATGGEVEYKADKCLRRRDLLVNTGKYQQQIQSSNEPTNYYKETTSAGRRVLY